MSDSAFPASSGNPASVRNSKPSPTTRWVRELASYVDYTKFRRVWQQPVTEVSERGYLAACYERVARQALQEGEYILAYDATRHGLRCAAAGMYPPHELMSLQLTALARSGAGDLAKEALEEFLTTHEADSTIYSARARLFRDLALEPGLGPEKRKRHLLDGAKCAAHAQECALEEGTDWAYPANQEAQLMFLAGSTEVARARARGVISYVQGRPDAASMWNQMNLAEMYLICGELEKAEPHYKAAVLLGAKSPGHLAANRKMASILLSELARHQPVDPDVQSRWFTKPLVVVFAGHLPDAPTRKVPRLPEALCRPKGPVAAAILQWLDGREVIEGICASAPGGDILFAEALAAMQTPGRLGIVEPFSHSKVLHEAERWGGDWKQRVDEVYLSAARVDPISCAEEANEPAQCEYATKVMLGTAILRAQRIDADLQALVLWDESDAHSPLRGGTGEFYNLCREKKVAVDIINPQKL